MILFFGFHEHSQELILQLPKVFSDTDALVIMITSSHHTLSRCLKESFYAPVCHAPIIGGD